MSYVWFACYTETVASGVVVCNIGIKCLFAPFLRMLSCFRSKKSRAGRAGYVLLDTRVIYPGLYHTQGLSRLNTVSNTAPKIGQIRYHLKYATQVLGSNSAIPGY